MNTLGKPGTFKVEQVNLEDGVEMLYRTDEFEDEEEACETFFNLKIHQWAIEEDVNHLYLVSPDDELIEQHSFSKCI